MGPYRIRSHGEEALPPAIRGSEEFLGSGTSATLNGAPNTFY